MLVKSPNKAWFDGCCRSLLPRFHAATHYSLDGTPSLLQRCRTENNDLYLGYSALTHPKYKDRTAILPKEVSRVAWKLNMGVLTSFRSFAHASSILPLERRLAVLD